MKYRVEIGGREREVDVEIVGDAIAVSLDGRAVSADVRRVPGGLSLILGGQVFDVMLGGKAERLQLSSGSARLQASALSERHRSRTSRGGKAGGAGELRSPMPGRIVEVSVSVGDTVAVGNPLVVIEAMKMQNELRAEIAGRVTKVEVSPEQNVDSDVLLVAIEPAAG